MQTNEKRKRNERKMNERFTRTIRKMHDTRNERMIHERTNEMKRTYYTENAYERTHDTRNERMIHKTNALYTNERIIGA